MYFRADPFTTCLYYLALHKQGNIKQGHNNSPTICKWINMRFVLLQFFRASDFSNKVLSVFLSFGDVLASS